MCVVGLLESMAYVRTVEELSMESVICSIYAFVWSSAMEETLTFEQAET